MPTNNRVFYATQLIHLNPQNTDGTAVSSQNFTPLGVQSVGITTNFNLTEVFSVGQLEVYDQPEDLPEIEVTMNKVFDGTPLLYHLCMASNTATGTSGAGATTGGIEAANDKSLTELGNNRVNFSLGVFADTSTNAQGTPDSYVTCSGMYLSSFTYTFGVDDNFTEDITLVGNSKIWDQRDGAPADFHAGFTGGSSSDFDSVFGTNQSAKHTARRFNIDYANSTFPEGSGGINRPGSTKISHAGTDGSQPYYQSVTISCDLGREEIRQLGQFDPYYRYITFPTEVTSEFEVVASEGDYLDASDFGGASACTSSYTQLAEKTIKIKVCSPHSSSPGDQNFLEFDLGSKNKVTSVNYSGGDAGGDNVTISYSFRNFNSFKIKASGEFADTAVNVG
tara:strand:+ start:2790 stop:3968 length:1179 start_codon:yes stop_codon:yes gene_type:complete